MKKIYEHNQMDFEPIQTVYPGEDEYDLRGPTGTQIVVYKERKDEPDVVFETSKTKCICMKDKIIYL